MHSLRGQGALRRGATSVPAPAHLIRGRGVPALLRPHVSPPLQIARAGVDTAAPKPRSKPKTAREAVETGLVAFQEAKDYAAAVRLFKAAIDLKPSEDEARAALFNLGCAYAKLREWQPATDAIVAAVNDHGLKLSVALQDPDLRELRERREWVDAVTQMKGGLSEDSKVQLRAEVKAPFRLSRMFLFGALAIGGAIGTLVSSTMLVGELQAPEKLEGLPPSLQNVAINLAVVAVAAFLIQRDLKARDKAVKITSREEALSRLQIKLDNDRQLPLGRFRGKVRPVILSGSKNFVERAIKDAQPLYQQLRNRGVSVIPVVIDSSGRPAPSLDPEDPEARIRALKRELLQQEASNKGFARRPGAEAVDPPEPVPAASAAGAEKKEDDGGVLDSDRKWRLEAYDLEEWRAWVEAQRTAAGMSPDLRDCFIQVQLDGTVRSSGLGIPPWSAFVDDLPPLDDIRTTFTDGIGPSM